MSFTILAPALVALCQVPHVPHDAGFGVAVGPVPGGGRELVLAADHPVRAARSRHDGISWEILSGDGLESQIPREVVYLPGPPALFLIATFGGIWAYNPETGSVEAWSQGLDLQHRHAVDVAAPDFAGSGPAFFLSDTGTLFRREASWSSWASSYESGLSVGPGQGEVAVVPSFDPDAGPGPEQTVLAALDGMLVVSQDGGASWNVHPQFPTPGLDGWIISAAAFDPDYPVNGVVLLGRSRLRPGDPRKDEGEILRSSDFGSTFEPVLALDSGIGSLGAASGADGEPVFLASGNMYPNDGYYQGTGILVSQDGLNWQDFGNEQDFMLESGPGEHTAVPFNLRLEQNFAFSPNFASDNTVWYTRSEGLFQTTDAGRHWLEVEFRPVNQIRDLAVAALPGFGAHVAGAAYGEGTLFLSGLKRTEVLHQDCPLPYQKAIAISPNFNEDGTMVIGGASDLAMWYSPSIPSANPFGATGWLMPPVAELGTGNSLSGYARTIAMSPHYDGTRSPGSDLAFYWSAWDDVPMRTRDGGLTGERLDQAQGGADAPFLSAIAIAPTYDDRTSTGRTDVYGGTEQEHTLYRLDDKIWKPVAAFDWQIYSIAVDPGFSRPSNPRLFVAIQGYPYVAEVLDYPDGAQVNGLARNLDRVLVMDVATAPDLDRYPFLFAGTWGSGVWRLDLSQGNAQWTPVGTGFPRWWTESLVVSPSYSTDRTLYAGTQYGVVIGRDLPGSTWTPLSAATARDDDDPGFTTFAPTLPENPDPTRAWPWLEVNPRTLYPSLAVTGETVRVAKDGMYFTTTGFTSKLQLKTFAGPGSGAVLITVDDYVTGAHLASVYFDLGAASPVVENYLVPVSLPMRSAVRVRVEVDLDPGEMVGFDGMVFEP